MRNKLTPEFRFPNYIEEWNSTKLGGIVSITMGQSPNGENYTENPVDHILVQGNADIKNGWVTPRVWTTQVTKTANKGDIILSVRAPVGDVGKTQYDVVLGRGVAGIKGNEFIFQLLSKLKSDGYWTRFSTGSTFDSINSTDLKDAIISVPEEEEEQSKIGSFFKQLDKRIVLHQQELNTLKQTKQGFLQKMFPKEDESVPEVRFPGFTGDWKQIRLGDRAIIKGRLGWKSLKQEEYISDGPSMIAGKHIKNGVINWDIVDHIPQWRYDESPEIMLKNGDVIFSKDGSLGNPALISDLNCLATINSTMMLVRVNETIDPSFFYQVMRSDRFERLIYLKVSGSSIPHLFQADMNDFLFVAPVKEEQIKIGNFFKELDDIIALNERELDVLKETKKAFLQKMFV